MELNEIDVKKISVIFIVFLLGVLAFLVVKPVLISVVTAMVLSYLFIPLQKRVSAVVKNKTLSALIISTGLIIILVVPIWFIIPIAVEQIFRMFGFTQAFDAQVIIQTIFPTATPQFAVQGGTAINNFIGTITSGALNAFVDILLNVPEIALHLFIIVFIFFFALRDHEQLKDFLLGLSPFNAQKEKVLIKNFRDITDSVVYGQIIIGIVQGLLAGLGFLIFGVDNALVLTLFAIFLSVLPIVGPAIIWIPVTLYLFAAGSGPIALAYLIYNILIVSTAENILRSYLVSRKTNISPAVILTGMVGGIFLLGIIGLIIGPLILAYFLIFLKSYRDKSLYTMFSEKYSKT